MTTVPPGFKGSFFSDSPTRSAYSEGAGPFRIVPDAVAVPRDRDDLIALIRYARDNGTALVPRGAGSGMLNPGVIVPSPGSRAVADLKVGPRAEPIPEGIETRLREIERTAAWDRPKDAMAG